MPRILIHGMNTLLGSHCAARWIAFQGSTVLYADDVSKKSAMQWVANAAGQIESGERVNCGPEQLGESLWPAGENFLLATGSTLPPISEIWFFDDGRTSQNELDAFLKLVCVYPGTLPLFLNCVQSGGDTADAFGEVTQECSTVNRTELTRQLESIFAARNIQVRIVKTPLIAGKLAFGLVSRDIVSEFLSVLHAFKQEIEERSPQYFDFHALRCFVPEDAALDVLNAVQVSEVLLRKNSDLFCGLKIRITGELKVPFATLGEHISTVFDLSFLPVGDMSTLNAVDRLFHERINCIQVYLGAGREQTTAKSFQATHVLNSECGEEAQLEFLESVKQNLDQAAVERKQRIVNLPGQMICKTIDKRGSELTYYLGGSSGPIVLLLNALGQGLEYWYRLIDILINEYRVILWEPRGTIAPPQPFGLADQVDDLQAILENEDIHSCHAVCWCTSPKVAIDFHLRQPSIFRSLTFLNSTFKCEGGPEEFDTPYERNLFSLCRMLIRKPEMAASVMKTFQSRSEESELEVLETPDAEQMSIAVLSRMNSELKPYVLGPFKTEATTLNYARQMMDFWANDCRAKAGSVTVPVLLIGAEHDQVISPASSEFGATLFPNARYIHLTGATHYFLHDRAPMLAGLLQKVFKNPADLLLAQSRPEMVASAS